MISVNFSFNSKIIISYSGGATVTASLTPGQSTIVTGSVFSAGTYIIGGSAVIGGITYTGSAGAKVITSSDITVPITLA